MALYLVQLRKYAQRFHMSFDKYPQPIVTVDLVLLTLKNRALHVALHRRDKEPFQGAWALLGGAVHAQEDLDAVDAAKRILKSKAGLVCPYFEQLETFAGATRDSRGWSVSIAYYAVVPHDSLGVMGDNVKWVPVDDLRALPFDHLTIVNKAVSRLRSKAQYSSLPLYLLPAEFTLSYVQRVYADIMGPMFTQSRRTFQRWLKELDILEPVPGKLLPDGGRPAAVFRLSPAYASSLALSRKNLT